MRPRKSSEEMEAQARRKAELIIRVQSGLLTATEAARQLGMSRKTYYKWEGRALKELMRAVQRQPGGRPPEAVDTEKEALKQQVQELQEKLRVMGQTQRIRDVMNSSETNAQKKSGDHDGG